MNKLIDFTCPKCGKHLAWSRETAMVYCKRCDRWIRAMDMKRPNPLKLDPAKEKEQLALFD